MREFKGLWGPLSDEEVEAYFEREGNEVTRTRYKGDVKSLKKGKINEYIWKTIAPRRWRIVYL